MSEIEIKLRDKEIMLKIFQNTMENLRMAKPNERSEIARRYAVTITEFEKVIAYFKVYVVDKE